MKDEEAEYFVQIMKCSKETFWYYWIAEDRPIFMVKEHPRYDDSYLVLKRTLKSNRVISDGLLITKKDARILHKI